MANPYFAADAIPQTLGIVLMVALGVGLIALRGARRVHHALAAHFLLRAGLNATVSVDDTLAATSPTWATLGVMSPYFEAPVLAATVWFALEFRAKFTGRKVARAWPWLLLAFVVAVDALYAWDHGLFNTHFLGAGAEARAGPLILVSTARIAAYAVVGWILARDAARLPDGAARRSVVLIAVAFALLPVYYASATVLGTASLLAAGQFAAEARAAGVWGVLDFLLTIPLLAFGAATVAVLRPLGARPARGAAVAVATAAATGAVAGLVFRYEWGPFYNSFWDGVWTAAVALVATYALVRHQLFGLDLKIKWTIKQSTVAAAFIGVFFVVSETAQTFFQSSVGPYLGIAAAGALVFALAPLQRVAERVATAAVPHARAPGELSPNERIAVYADQVRLAWADGAIDRNERILLNGLRDRLGLTHEEAARAEDQALAAG